MSISINGVEVKIKPRESLRETAFRRYEKWIGMACRGSVLVSPLEQVPPCKASSFVVGVREAMRGMRLFDYKTKEIPIGYELRRIQVLETEDGKVLLRNEYEDKVGMERFREKSDLVLTRPPVDVNENGELLRRERKDPYDKKFKFVLKEQREEFMKVCEQVQTKLLSPWENWIGVKTDGSEEEEAMVKNIWKEFDQVDAIKLQHNWWMLTC